MADVNPPIPSDVKLARPLKGPGAPGSPGGPPPPPSTATTKGKGGPADKVQPPEEEGIPLLTFWQQPWVQNVLPFVTSACIHLLLILVGWATLKAVQNIVSYAKTSEQIIVPENSPDMSDDAPEGGVENPGYGGDPTRPARQDKDPNAPDNSQMLGDTPNNNQRPALAGGGANGMTDLISFGEADGPGYGGHGLGGGQGDGQGSGSGAGLGLAPFGAPGGGGGLGPKSKVFGHGSHVHSVIYICDGSGSMMGNKIDVLKVELLKSINGLQPSQEFDCMFFQDPNGDRAQAFMAVGNGQMLRGTPENKKKAEDFLDDVTVHGSTDPRAALEQAWREQPVLVYLLTDGEFDDPDSDVIEAKINALNVDKKVHLNTILFLATKKEQAENKEFEATMTKMASENGGEFREFYSDEL